MTQSSTGIYQSPKMHLIIVQFYALEDNVANQNRPSLWCLQ